MLQTLYWILAILVMTLLLINAIRCIKSDKEFRNYIKKQNMVIDNQIREIYKDNIKEIEKLLNDLKKEEDK